MYTILQFKVYRRLYTIIERKVQDLSTKRIRFSKVYDPWISKFYYYCVENIRSLNWKFTIKETPSWVVNYVTLHWSFSFSFLSGRSKLLRIVYSEIKDRVFSTKDLIFAVNHHKLLANDRILSIKIVLYQLGSNNFDDTLEQDRSR